MPYRVVLDDEVIAKAKAEGEPLVDSVNSVVRRALGLSAAPQQAIFFGIEVYEDEGEVEVPGTPEPPRPRRSRRARKGRTRRRAPKGSLLDERAYWQPILRVLDQAPNGAAPAREVIAAVGEVVDDQLTPLDRETLEDGGLRWQTRVQFARLRMKDAGLIAPDSPRGIWQITDEGRRALERATLTAA
jgi:hypothetical protein